MTLTKKQLQLRKNLLTASDIATVFGLNQYKSPLRLFYEKTGAIEPDTSASGAALMGHVKERWIASHYKKLHPGVSLKKSGTISHGFYGATPDRFVFSGDDEWLLECKATSKAFEWRSGVPERFKMQVQWQMMVTGLDRCDVCADAGSLWFEYVESRDSDYIEALKSAADQFWWHVKNNKAPGFLGLEDEAKAIGLAFPEDNGATLDMTDNEGLELAFKALADHEARATETENNIAVIKNSIREVMKDHKRLRVSEYEAIYSTVTRKASPDFKKAFRAVTKNMTEDEIALILEPFTKPASTHRSFKIKRKAKQNG